MAQDRMEGALPKKMEQCDSPESTKASDAPDQLSRKETSAEMKSKGDMQCVNSVEESKLDTKCPPRSAGIIKV